MFNDLVFVKKIRQHKAKDMGLPKTGGVYKFWCDKELYCDFLRQLQTFGLKYDFDDIKSFLEKCVMDDKVYYCFYVGQTQKSLAKRIKNQHIGAKEKKNPDKGSAINRSTLRKSINALKNGAKVYDENYVDRVLDKCYVQWVSLSGEEIDDKEIEEINSHIRLLNRDDFVDNAQEFLAIRGDIAKALKSARTKKKESIDFISKR